jgi:hypothetical protein
LNYISESNWSPKCGSLEIKWFPYEYEEKVIEDE